LQKGLRALPPLTFDTSSRDMVSTPAAISAVATVSPSYALDFLPVDMDRHRLRLAQRSSVTAQAHQTDAMKLLM
jgi:hypothetical protein